MLLIIVSLAFLDGARRQLDLQSTVFGGELILRLRIPVENLKNTLLKIKSVAYVSEKLRSPAVLFSAGVRSGAQCTLIGCDPANDAPLLGYISLREGRLPEKENDILLPDNLADTLLAGIGSTVQISGRNSRGISVSGISVVCGIYHAPGFTFFKPPQVLLFLDCMKTIFDPLTRDIEYGIFFSGEPPEDINRQIARSLGDSNRNVIESLDTGRASVWDVENISVQFGVFLFIVISLVIAVVITVAFAVNFSIGMIIFRQQIRETGTLLAFGVTPARVTVVMLLESLLQTFLCLAAAIIVTVILRFISALPVHGGFGEFVLVLFTGTSRLDLFFQPYQYQWAFLITGSTVVLSRLPYIIRFFFSRPVSLINHAR